MTAFKLVITARTAPTPGPMHTVEDASKKLSDMIMTSFAPYVESVEPGMDPHKAALVAQATLVFSELVEDAQLFEDMCYFYPELMDRLRKVLS
jgi:hypothetical protein